MMIIIIITDQVQLDSVLRQVISQPLLLRLSILMIQSGPANYSVLPPTRPGGKIIIIIQ